MADPYVKQALREAQARDLLECLDEAAGQASYLELVIDFEDRIERQALDIVTKAIEQANAFITETLAEMKERGTTRLHDLDDEMPF